MRARYDLDLWGNVLTRAGGVLLLLGALLPWAWLPVAGLSVPWLGVMGPGIAASVAGYLLAVRRLPWQIAGAVALASLALGAYGYGRMPVSVRGGLLSLQAHVEPVNGLLARFQLPPVILFDMATRVKDLRGPGPATVLWGAVCSVAGAGLRGRAVHERRARNVCDRCGHIHPPDRDVLFCVRCGDLMPGRVVCAACRAAAEPDDIHCAACGARLSGGQEPC